MNLAIACTLSNPSLWSERRYPELPANLAIRDTCLREWGNLLWVDTEWLHAQLLRG